MPSFTARVLTSSGSKDFKIDAPDLEDARVRATQRGQLISIKRNFGLDFSPGMSAGERNKFMIRLSSMVGSKMGAAEALRLIAETFPGRIKHAAAGMVQRIEAGSSLPDAMDADRKNFPLATTALVRAGVEGGETWKALRDAAEFEDQIRSIQKSSGKDMALAIVNFIVAVAMMWFTTEWLGPQITDNPMFKNNPNVDVGWIETAGRISTWVMMVMLGVMFAFIALGTIGKGIFPNLADKIILRVPFYKDLILSRNSYVVLYKLGLLVRSGVRMEDSLSLTARSSPRGAMRADMERALAALRAGENWALALDTMHPTDKAALSASTDREDIGRTLDMLASQYKSLYISRMQSFAPALMAISALAISLAGLLMFGLTIMPTLQFSGGM